MCEKKTAMPKHEHDMSSVFLSMCKWIRLVCMFHLHPLFANFKTASFCESGCRPPRLTNDLLMILVPRREAGEADEEVVESCVHHAAVIDGFLFWI